MNPPTFGDLIQFIVENKKDKVFIGDSLQKIIEKCQKGLKEGTLLFSVGTDNAITGMILAEENWPEEGVLFVIENLSMSLKNLIEFAKIAKERKPHCRLEWFKHGIHKTHNTDKFYEKLKV